MDLKSILLVLTILFLVGIWGIFSNRKNIRIVAMSEKIKKLRIWTSCRTPTSILKIKAPLAPTVGLWERLTQQQYCDQWDGPRTPDNLMHRGPERALNLSEIDAACGNHIRDNQELISQRWPVVEALRCLGFSDSVDLTAETAQLTNLLREAADKEWSLSRRFDESCMRLEANLKRLRYLEQEINQ